MDLLTNMSNVLIDVLDMLTKVLDVLDIFLASVGVFVWAF